MANNQELQEDFSQDVKDDQHLNGDEAAQTGENGTENGNDNGVNNENENSEQGQTNEASGRDDDRLVAFSSYISLNVAPNLPFFFLFDTAKFLFLPSKITNYVVS